MIDQLIIVLHVLTCITLVVLILMQQGKGADMGAAFGGGASNTVFGSPGSSSFLFKFTAFLAAVFFTTSIVLSNLSTTTLKAEESVMVPGSTPAPSTQVPAGHSNKTFVLPVEKPSNQKKQNNQ